MDQLQNEFLIDLEELIEQIYEDLDALREAGAGGPLTRALIDRIFRRVHSIKGSAATFGLQALSQIAHEFESLLGAARAGKVFLAGAALTTCESANDAMAESLTLAASGVVEPSRNHLFEQLQAITRAVARDSDLSTIIGRVPAEISDTLTDPEKHQLVSALKEGIQLFIISTSFDVANFDEEFFRLKAKLAEWGEVISTSPSLENSQLDKINFRLLYAARIGERNLKTNLGQLKIKLEPVRIDAGKSAPEMPAAGLPGDVSSVSALANYVRTDLDALDRLISSTHQLFRRTTNALKLAEDLAARNSAQATELTIAGDAIESAFLAVEDQLISLRLISLGPMLQRAVRAGKTAARLAGKEIDFQVFGGELRFDKLLVDAIANPLIQLIRNAVDHGIEDSEARVTANKRRRGTIRVEATSKAGRSRVVVSDDGRGIDVNTVSVAASRLGIVEPGVGLDLDRSVRLLFRPGFTTLESASDLSGRGVGLDVVESGVEQAGGELRVSTQPGAGTTFEIHLPMTFGLMEAQVVTSDGHRYCVALSPPIDKEPTVSLATVSLRELLGQPPRPTQTAVSTGSSKSDSDDDSEGHSDDDSEDSPVITKQAVEPTVITCRLDDEAEDVRDDQRYGIIVDEIEAIEKVLVRGLGRHAGRWYGVAGATELGDGSIALVLDLPRLLSSYQPA